MYSDEGEEEESTGQAAGQTHDHAPVTPAAPQSPPPPAAGAEDEGRADEQGQGPERELGKKRANGDDAHATASGSADLLVFAPPPRTLVDGVDAEWGLGLEKATTGVDEALQAKLAHFHTLKAQQGTHFNQSLARNRSFRNPHIYAKLVEWVEVDETGSAYGDMVRAPVPDDVWTSSKAARTALKVHGSRESIGECPARVWRVLPAAEAIFSPTLMSLAPPLHLYRSFAAEETTGRSRRAQEKRQARAC